MIRQILATTQESDPRVDRRDVKRLANFCPRATLADAKTDEKLIVGTDASTKPVQDLSALTRLIIGILGPPQVKT